MVKDRANCLLITMKLISNLSQTTRTTSLATTTTTTNTWKITPPTKYVVALGRMYAWAMHYKSHTFTSYIGFISSSYSVYFCSIVIPAQSICHTIFLRLPTLFAAANFFLLRYVTMCILSRFNAYFSYNNETIESVNYYTLYRMCMR